MSLKRYLWSIGAIILALVFVQVQAVADTGTGAGTSITNRAMASWLISGSYTDTESPAGGSADTTIRRIASDTMTAPANGSVSVGGASTFSYTIVNTGNAADTFTIWLETTTQGAGAASWTCTLFVGGQTATATANDTKVTVSLGAGASYTGCSVVVTASSNAANAPDGSFLEFRMVIWPGNGNTADTTTPYTGDNGRTYAEGTAGSFDYARASVSAPRISLAKAVSAVRMAGLNAMPLPGATVEYTLTYNNEGTAIGDSVIIRDTIPANCKFDTASYSDSNLGASATFADDTGQSGWTCQYATAAAPTNTFYSANWLNLNQADDSGYAARNNVTYIRWIRTSVAAAQTATIRFRVIIQ